MPDKRGLGEKGEGIRKYKVQQQNDCKIVTGNIVSDTVMMMNGIRCVLDLSGGVPHELHKSLTTVPYT